MESLSVTFLTLVNANWTWPPLIYVEGVIVNQHSAVHNCISMLNVNTEREKINILSIAVCWSGRAPRISCFWLCDCVESILECRHHPPGISSTLLSVHGNHPTCCIFSPNFPPSLSKTFREGINNAPGNGELNIIWGFYFLSLQSCHSTQSDTYSRGKY